MHNKITDIYDAKAEVRPWPQDWPKHIVKSNDLYFDSSRPIPIETLQFATRFEAQVSSNLFDENMNLNFDAMVEGIVHERTTLQVIYRAKDKVYIADHNQDAAAGSNTVMASVYRLLCSADSVGDETLSPDLAMVPGADDWYVCKAVGFLRARSGYEVVTKVEDIISRDWDDDNDDYDESPELDPNPSSSLDLAPAGSA